jgi:hypothetical protein
MVKGTDNATYLPCRHPLQLSDRCDTAQNPSKLCMILDLFWDVNWGQNDQIELSGHLVLMKNDGSLGIYARCKYECHHGCPRFREKLGILGQCEGMPANDREKELVSRGSSRL